MLALLLYALVATAHTPYNIRLFESFLPLSLAHDLVASADLPVTYELHHVGPNQYLCALPPPRPSSPPQPTVPDASVLASAVDLISDSFSSDSCVWAYDLRGSYWSYAFCNADKIIQYHEAAPVAERASKHVAKNPDDVFVLGRFSRHSASRVLFENQAPASSYSNYVAREAPRTFTLKEEQSSPFSHASAQKVVSQMVTDGSVCDMTGQPRSIEVVYMCDSAVSSSRPQILEVHEIKVCHYKMLLHVPNLCSHEAFVPDKYVQDHLVDVNCQRVANDTEHVPPLAPDASFDDYLNRTVLREHSVFPVRADNRIDVADHHVVSLNRGFYIARSKSDPASSSEYVNQRNVVLFNGAYTSLSDLNLQFAQSMLNCVGTKLFAPIVSHSQSGEPILATMLEWSHTFVLFFEIYDFKGEFVGISKISHDATREQRTLTAVLLDPKTLLDNEGDIEDLVNFERPDFEAPEDLWNFQIFDQEGKSLKNHMSAKLPTESRLFIVYNRGWENNRVKVEVVDEMSGLVLPGEYTAENEYTFVYDIGSGLASEYSIKPIEEYQDFFGFRVDVPVSAVPTDSGPDTPLDTEAESGPDEEESASDDESSEVDELTDARDKLGAVLRKIVDESQKTWLAQLEEKDDHESEELSEDLSEEKHAPAAHEAHIKDEL